MDFHALDYLLILLYLALPITVGPWLIKQISSSEDLFSAGGKSPWWLSGMSGYMTMFSSGTFVVWGGIAYKHGLVAVSICMTLGVSAFLVGMFLAAKWKSLGVSSASEYISIRYGKTVLQLYTWLMMVTRMLGVAIATYAFSIQIAVIIPVPASWFIASDTLIAGTNMAYLDTTWAIVMTGLLVISYTVVGGLWSVLITDMIQFVVLLSSVLIAIPLVFQSVGGVGEFVSNAPDGFFSPTNGNFTWAFLVGWTLIHMFKIGGEWAFVQRYTCVPSEKDAKKSAYLFGALYLITPIFWMLPPMIYRIVDPNVNPEQAYILACQKVFPIGLMGMLLASMFSATASMAIAELNVFAGTITRDIYSKFFKEKPSEFHLINAGRVFTVLLGMATTAIAVAIPYMGGAEKVIISITSLFVGPMVMPTIWALFSKRINTTAVIATVAVTAGVAALIKYPLADWAMVSANPKLAEIVVGLGVPFLILIIFEWMLKKEHPSIPVLEGIKKKSDSQDTVTALGLPVVIMTLSLVLQTVVFITVAIIAPEAKTLIFIAAGICAVLAALLGKNVVSEFKE